MDIEPLIGQVGEDRFAAASDAAWASAARTGRPSAASLDEDTAELLAEVVWDLAELIASAEKEADRVQGWLAVYRRCPCYSLLFEIAVQYYRHLSGSGRRQLWEGLRELLDAKDDRLADPIAYSLWVDYFEDPDRLAVEETWRLLVDGRPKDRALRRILEVSGPVPVALKGELFQRTIDDRTWHDSIFRALVNSRTAMYGEWDVAWGQGVFDRLEQPAREAQDVEAAITEFVQQEIRRTGQGYRDIDPTPIQDAFADLLGRRYFRPG